MNESPLGSLDLAFWSLHGIKTKALEAVKYFLFSFIINNVYVGTLVAFACKNEQENVSLHVENAVKLVY